MGTAVQYRRGTTINHSTFIGLEGEITVDTTKNVPVVHDGLTPGGTPTAKASDVTDLANTVSNKVDKVVGKQLSTEDYTTLEKSKLSGIAANANNYVKPVNEPISYITGLQTALDNKTTMTDVNTAISNVVGAAPAALDTLVEIANQLANDESAVSALTTTVSNKVDKVVGKQLSTEDYSTAEKTKLANLVVMPDGSGSNPVGTIITFAKNTAPTGYLKANGALLSRTTYSALFAVIGTTFGIGDGSTTFALPDLRGYFPRGWDDGRGIDTSRVFGSNQGDAYLNHSHTGSTSSAGAHTHTAEGSVSTQNADGTFNTLANKGTVTTSSAGAHTHTITVAASTTGATETRPKNIALLYCIKY